MQQTLTSTLATIGNCFEPDELSYLALTTKIENPLRDRWAFSLHKKLLGNLTVSREWHRTDIAILKNGIPRALIELKAIYTFDAALDKQSASGSFKAMQADELKVTKLDRDNSEIYTVLLATHPKSPVPNGLYRVVKYHEGINKAFKQFGSELEVLREARESIEKGFSSKQVVASGSISGGQSFGISTDVMYWVVRA
jgi:hypothetical protein